MRLQMALDDVTLEEALARVAQAAAYVDIVEVGTPMVMQYGMEPVRRIKALFPALEVLADLKIMDAGLYEAELAFRAGADYITVLGVTDDLTVAGCVEAARRYGGRVVADMICVKDLPGRIQRLEALGVDTLSVHVGVDQQAAGRTPLDDLKVMKAWAKAAKISVAGGISIASLPAYRALSPDVVIVGGGIAHAADPTAAAKALYDAIHA